MSVFKKEGSPYWQYEFIIEGSRFRGSTRLTNKIDAQKFEANKRRSILLGEEGKPTMTMSEAFGTWYSHVGQHTKTHRTVIGQIERLLKSLGPQTQISSVSLADLRRHVLKRRAFVSNATVNREIELCRRVWRWLEPDDVAVSKIDWSKLILDEPKERVRSLSYAEQERLLDELPHDLKQVVLYALMTGKRKSEVINLTWSDIDFDGRRAKFRVKGGSIHALPMTPEMMALVESQPKSCPQVFTFEARSTSNRYGRKTVKGVRYPFSESGWSRQWRAALKRAGVADFRFHDLRHTLATRLLRATGNLKVVQKVLGHTDIATTSKYAHVDDEDMLNGLMAVPHTIPTVNSGNAKKARKTNGLRSVG